MRAVILLDLCRHFCPETGFLEGFVVKNWQKFIEKHDNRIFRASGGSSSRHTPSIQSVIHPGPFPNLTIPKSTGPLCSQGQEQLKQVEKIKIKPLLIPSRIEAINLRT